MAESKPINEKGPQRPENQGTETKEAQGLKVTAKKKKVMLSALDQMLN